jgi:molecular chaperone GrpE
LQDNPLATAVTELPPASTFESCDSKKLEQNPLWQAIFDRLGALADRLDRTDAPKQTNTEGGSVLDELHAQLQEARADLHWKILRPVLLDLVKLHDQIAQAMGRSTDGGGILTEFRQDIEDILYRQGFNPFTVEDDRFDPRRQQPVSTLPTPAPEKARTIAQRVAPGFASENRVLRPEKVVVYAATSAPTTVTDIPRPQ